MHSHKPGSDFQSLPILGIFFLLAQCLLVVPPNICRLNQWRKTAFAAGVGMRWQTHILIRLRKLMHLGFLSYQVAQAGQRFVLEGKSNHEFGLCMQMSVWNIVCGRGLIFFHFPCFWAIVKPGQSFSPITQMMRLLFLAQWGLTLIREGTKCCFSSCLAV